MMQPQQLPLSLVSCRMGLLGSWAAGLAVVAAVRLAAVQVLHLEQWAGQQGAGQQGAGAEELGRGYSINYSLQKKLFSKLQLKPVNQQRRQRRYSINKTTTAQMTHPANGCALQRGLGRS